MKQAVMYGGGNIGRGFIGATLSQSGYEVTFIDVAEPVVKALQEKKQYPVRYVSSEGHEDVVIEHVTAVNGNDQEAASEAIANCDIMATAVGARILKFIVGNIVAGLRKRWARDDRPLNIIICENLMDANKVMEGMLKDLLTDEEKKHFDEKGRPGRGLHWPHGPGADRGDEGRRPDARVRRALRLPARRQGRVQGRDPRDHEHGPVRAV